MKTLLSILVLLTLPGCAELLVTYKNASETWCSYVTDERVKIERDKIMADIKDGTDKAEAQRILDAIGVTSEHACETIKSLRAARAIRQTTALDDK